jgi:hypothetical protein
MGFGCMTGALIAISRRGRNESRGHSINEIETQAEVSRFTVARDSCPLD